MKTESNQINPIVYAITTFFNKLRQNPNVYPIKYYKKANRFKRSRKSTLLK